MAVTRRGMLHGAGAASLAVVSARAGAKVAPFVPMAGPRSRVIYINDLSGDIDGLFATVHALLSPAAQLRAIIGTSTWSQYTKDETAERSAELGREILKLMRLEGRVPVYAGAKERLTAASGPDRSTAVEAIIAEARRSDAKLPLYVTVGGGLTEVASALMLAPDIASKFTLVWIGGDALPNGGTGESNFTIDPIAARFIFNETTLPIWQVPRAVYATCLVSATELQVNVAPHGKIGRWLYQRVVEAPALLNNMLNMGETWTLGDNPLVALTALNDWVPNTFQPFLYQRTGSSLYDEVVCPILNADGTFSPRTEGRKIRIYKSIDTRMMFADFYAKLQVNARR